MKKIILPVIILLFSRQVLAQIPSYIPLLGLEAYYPFDSSAADVTGNGNDGTMLVDATYYTDRFGVSNHAYLGDGNSGINVPVNHYPVGNSATSVSCWYKTPLPYTAGGIMQMTAWGNNSYEGARFGLMLDEADTAIGFESCNSAVFAIKFGVDSNWHNLVVTYPDSGAGTASIKVYQDGIISPTYVINPISALNVTSGYISCLATLFESPFRYSWIGGLDDIGIWNRELKPCEVVQIVTGAVDSPAISASGDTLSAAGGYATYQWELGGSVIAGATNAVYVPADSGTYTVLVTDTSGCSGQNSYDNHPLSTTAFHAAQNRYSIAPNPAINEMIITADKPAHYTLSIFNTSGQIVKTMRGAKQMETVDVSKLPIGVYEVCITDELGNKENKKLTVLH